MLTQRLREKFMTSCPDALIHHDRIAFSEWPPLPIYPDRAGGDVECVICKKKLYDHPQHPQMDGNVVITCTGQFFKL